MGKGNTQLKADLMLLALTMCWGVSYAMISAVLEDLEPFVLCSYRFLGSFVLMMLLFRTRLLKVDKRTLLYGLAVGFCLYLCYIGATFGVLFTSLSNVGFLCGMSVIIIPIFTFFVYRKPPEKRLYPVLLLCLLGIGLMTLNEGLHLGIGDLLCIGCAVAYAADALVTEAAVKEKGVDPLLLGAYSLLFAGLFHLASALVSEDFSLPTTPRLWFFTIFLMIFCTGLPFALQPIAQQYTTATHLGVIFTLEPVFGAIVAFAFVGERLLPRNYLGCVILLLAMLLMEVPLPGRKKHKDETPRQGETP